MTFGLIILEKLILILLNGAVKRKYRPISHATILKVPVFKDRK
jgi:hypothetical protein